MKVNLIKEATHNSKNQPKLFLTALKASIKKVKSDKTVNGMKDIISSIQAKKSLNKKQASTLFVLLSTTKVRKNTIKQFGQKKYQQAMLYLFLIMYNNSSFISKFLMRSYMKQGLKNLLK